MRKILLATAFAVALCSSALANWTGKDASSTTITFVNPNICSSVACVPIASISDPTGANLSAVPTAGADAQSNTANGLLTYGRNLVFNGTTWDRWQGAVTVAGVATAALQGTNTATTSHTCSVSGFSELGCLGQIDDDIKAALPAGSNTIGNVGIVAGTATMGNVGLTPNTTGGGTPFHLLSAASNNSTNVKASAGTLYNVTVTQTTTTLGDLRFYDSATAPTCSSATGVVFNAAVQSNTTSPGFTINFGPYGKKFSNGIGFCLTGAVADNDNTNFVTGIQVNLDYN